MIYIWDIDSTLANIDHRLHFIEQTPADWDAFNMETGKDTPIWETITVARALAAAGHINIMVTGRLEVVREATVAWLRKYRIPFECIYMRGNTDHQKADVLKCLALDHIKSSHPGKEIGGVFEDHQPCVDMFRARGLRVFQVAVGNF
jgi:hypothetical protein